MSRPTRARELKPDCVGDGFIGDYVAPHAGARIETARTGGDAATSSVAPHAGARIETLKSLVVRLDEIRRAPRGGAN